MFTMRNRGNATMETEYTRKTGTVSGWRDGMGFGMILPDDGGSDIFCHESDIQGPSSLTVSSRVSYRYTKTARGVCATEVRVEREKSNRLYGTIINYNEARGLFSIDRYDGLGHVTGHELYFQGDDEPVNGTKVSFIHACSDRGDMAVRIREEDEIPEMVQSDTGREFGTIVGGIPGEDFLYVERRAGGPEAHLQLRACTDFSPMTGMCISFVFERNGQGLMAKDARQEDARRVARVLAPRLFGIVDFYNDPSRPGFADGYGFIAQRRLRGAPLRYFFHMGNITTPDEYGGIWPPLCVSFVVVSAADCPHGVQAVDVTVVENPGVRMEEEQLNFLLSTLRIVFL